MPSKLRYTSLQRRPLNSLFAMDFPHQSLSNLAKVTTTSNTIPTTPFKFEPARKRHCPSTYYENSLPCSSKNIIPLKRVSGNVVRGCEREQEMKRRKGKGFCIAPVCLDKRKFSDLGNGDEEFGKEEVDESPRKKRGVLRGVDKSELSFCGKRKERDDSGGEELIDRGGECVRVERGGKRKRQKICRGVLRGEVVAGRGVDKDGDVIMDDDDFVSGERQDGGMQNLRKRRKRSKVVRKEFCKKLQANVDVASACSVYEQSLEGQKRLRSGLMKQNVRKRRSTETQQPQEELYEEIDITVADEEHAKPKARPDESRADVAYIDGALHVKITEGGVERFILIPSLSASA